MIFSSFFKAVGQLPDRAFQGVLWTGIGLTVLLLLAVYGLFIWAIMAFVPDEIVLPWIGAVGGLDTLLSVGAIPLVLVMSVFLMVPVASLFMGFFLERIADAVEARHYPHLPPARGVGFYETLKDAVNFFAILIVLNLLAFVLALFVGPFAPLVFWGVNGFLLGREYFMLAAMRRIGVDGARSLRKRNRGRIWAAGTLMAIPLSIPVINLLIPVLGAATFTHLYHRMAGSRA